MRSSVLAVVLLVTLCLRAGHALEVDMAELNFDATFNKPNALKTQDAPAWITKIEQLGGRFRNEPRCWQVLPTQPKGTGRLTISINRKLMKENLVATLLFDAGENSDIAIQLFDAQGRVVVVDLFGNIVEVGKDATTDTFIVPLAKYPTAEKIVIRRITGDLKLYGMVLFPVVTEGTPVPGALEELARVLGDPLSPENPMLKSLQQVAKTGKVALEAGTASDRTNNSEKTSRGKLVSLTTTQKKAALRSTSGLVAHWNFDDGQATDSGELKLTGQLRGGVQFVPGHQGQAIRLDSSKRQAVVVPNVPAINLTESVTAAAWIKYSTIPGYLGAQIIWYGDDRLGRDPVVLHLDNDGTLEFRSDRSVTGKPIFTVFDNELQLTSSGDPLQTQHVSVQAPDTLAPATWYFVAGTLEKRADGKSSLKLYVDGKAVGETITPETVNYSTDGMWFTIGGVDAGTWQNFDGLIDDVRVYDRALSPTEIQALYQQR